MDILFVNQPRLGNISVPREIDCANPQKDFFVQPLALAYMASAARKKGCGVDLIDLNMGGKDYNYIAPILKKEKPKIVIGGFTTPAVFVDMELCKFVKEYSNAKVGIWGPIPSSIRDFLYEKFPDLDFIIENEPEFTIEEIAIKLKKAKDPFLKTKGISYRKGKKIFFNGFRKLGKLDDIPMPAYDLLPMKKYSTPYNKRLPMTIMRTSRGCIAKCTFCLVGGQVNPLVGYGSFWRAHSPKRSVDEIEYVVKKFGIKEINFFDAELTIDKKRNVEICKEISRRKINVIWNCNSRVDSVDKEVLFWMKKAGCYSISYGVESANKNIIRRCKKNITNEQVEKAIIMTKNAEIIPAIYFILGLPGETKESVLETINFAKEMAIKYNIRPQCTIATPYPGTAFYEEARKERWLKENIENLEQTTASIAYPHLSQQELEYWHKEFYKKVVLNPKRLFKRVLRIKHFNEIKSIPKHIKEFSVALLTKTRYIR